MDKIAIIGVGVVGMVLLGIWWASRRMSGNWLANVFEWNRQVIEAAETPFARLAIFVLPILAPIVPAFMTALHVYKLMDVIFPGDELQWVRVAMGGLVGVVLELLGYVGAVAFLQAVYKWIRTKTLEYAVPAALNGLAYGFYLGIMWMINVQLGRYFGTPDIVNQIVGWLSFLTVPTSLLAANHLNDKADTDHANKIRQENREDSLKKTALKHGINIFAQGTGDKSAAAKSPKERHASQFKDKIPAMLQAHYEKTGKVLELTDITAELKLHHGKNKGTVHSYRKEWAESRGISLEKPKKDWDGFTIPR